MPVAIHGTCRIWPPGRKAIHAAQVRVVTGTPLPTSGLTDRDVAGLRDQARDAICLAEAAELIDLGRDLARQALDRAQVEKA